MATNGFKTLTIDGIPFAVQDDTKLPRPAVEGTDGQVLVKQGEGTAWTTLAVGDDKVTDARVSLIEGAVTELDEALTGVEGKVGVVEPAIGN